jgi:hypothetical protein
MKEGIQTEGVWEGCARGAIGPNRNKTIGGWRKMRKEELYYLND